MDTKKFCSYCNHFEMNTEPRFPVYTCTHYKMRIFKDEQAEKCPYYTKLVIQTKREDIWGRNNESA